MTTHDYAISIAVLLFMVIGLVMSTAAMLYVARCARDDSDALWFVKAYFAVLRPVILAPGFFRLLTNARRAADVGT